MRRIIGKRSKLAFTMTEVMVSVAVSSMVMLATAGLQYYSARQIKQLYSQTAARSQGVQAMDAIRIRLSNARSGVNAVTITNSGNRVEFRDPNLAGNSVLEFRDHETLAGAKGLYYEQIEGEDPQLIAYSYPMGANNDLVGVTNVTFAAYGIMVGGVLNEIEGVTATIETYAILPKDQYLKQSDTVQINFRNDW